MNHVAILALAGRLSKYPIQMTINTDNWLVIFMPLILVTQMKSIKKFLIKKLLNCTYKIEDIPFQRAWRI